jgi:Asp-tRNA(Asn)/Glu-tRNA(Gln) amidotransferase A subunit family amidase
MKLSCQGADYGFAIPRQQRNRQIQLAWRRATTLLVFNVPAPMLGIPALALPLLSADGPPLGLQVMGFSGEDARLFAIAAAIRDWLAAAR